MVLGYTTLVKVLEENNGTDLGPWHVCDSCVQLGLFVGSLAAGLGPVLDA